mmetsp:Transcript_77601/g.214443  ORF Transcript_77601/g.214443 Transcript_77601/m.214443 type:complete len:315 (-) Transcript_77601:511-1455(-)
MPCFQPLHRGLSLGASKDCTVLSPEALEGLLRCLCGLGRIDPLWSILSACSYHCLGPRAQVAKLFFGVAQVLLQQLLEVVLELSLLLLELLELSSDGLLQEGVCRLGELLGTLNDATLTLRLLDCSGLCVELLLEALLQARKFSALLVALLHVLALLRACLVKGPRDLVQFNPQLPLALLQLLQFAVDLRASIVHVLQLRLNAFLRLAQLAFKVPLPLRGALRGALQADDVCLDLLHEEAHFTFAGLENVTPMGLSLLEVRSHCTVRLQELHGGIHALLVPLLGVLAVLVRFQALELLPQVLRSQCQVLRVRLQ